MNSSTVRSSDNLKDVLTVHPKELDIICGRGKAAANHPGNKRFRNIAEKYCHQYALVTTKKDKANITKKVMADILSSGCTMFLQKDPIFEERIYVTTHKAAKDKVSHFLKSKSARRSHTDRQQQYSLRRHPVACVQPIRKLQSTAMVYQASRTTNVGDLVLAEGKEDTTHPSPALEMFDFKNDPATSSYVAPCQGLNLAESTGSTQASSDDFFASSVPEALTLPDRIFIFAPAACKGRDVAVAVQAHDMTPAPCPQLPNDKNECTSLFATPYQKACFLRQFCSSNSFASFAEASNSEKDVLVSAQNSELIGSMDLIQESIVQTNEKDSSPQLSPILPLDNLSFEQHHRFKSSSSVLPLELAFGACETTPQLAQSRDYSVASGKGSASSAQSIAHDQFNDQPLGATPLGRMCYDLNMFL